MSINHKMTGPIEKDGNKVPAIVNEAFDGKKAVPTELVVKRTDDSTFEQVNESNGLPVKVTGNYVGYSTETKPTEGVNKGDGFLELDTKDVYFYDGTTWVVF